MDIHWNCLGSFEVSTAFVKILDQVIQSIISLTSSLVVKMLTVLVNTISNSQIFFTEKMGVAFAIFFSKNNSVYVCMVYAYMLYLMIKVLTIS